MKKRKILYLSLVVLSLIIGIFAVSASAADDTSPVIISKNISYDNDLKFIVAVPKSAVTDSLTFTVSAGEKSYIVTKTVAELSSDGLSDPTLGGVECYAIMSELGVPLKDMAKEYTLTVSSGGKSSAAIEYSVAEYLYERLFKNARVLSYDGTADADRRSLYFSTLACGADAERVLYNRNDDPEDDIETFVDEYFYSNISGAAELYKSGAVVTLAKETQAYKYTLTDGVWSRSTVTLPAGECTVDAHLILCKEYATVDFENGYILGDYLQSVNVGSGTDYDSIVAGESKGGNAKTYYEVTDSGLPAGSDGKVLKITQDNTKTTCNNSSVNIYNTSGSDIGTIYVLDFDAYFNTPDVTNTTRTLFQIHFGGASVNVQTYQSKIKILNATQTPVTLNSWGSFRVVFDVTGDGAATAYVYYRDAESGEMVLVTSGAVSGTGIKTSGVDHVTLYSYNSCANAPYVYYLDNISFARTSDSSFLPFKWTSISSVNLVSEETGSWQDTLISKFKTNTSLTLTSYSSSSPQTANELCIGNTGRPVSDVAYDLLSQKIAESEYDDPDGYVIYIEDGSIAIAYTSAAARTEAINKLLQMSASVELVLERGVMSTAAYSLVERAGESREKMYETYLADIRVRLITAGVSDADQIVENLRTFYSLYDTDTLLWLANLYDIERGGFYFSNSARDTLGFLPDLESTSFVLSLADNGGLFAEFVNLKAHGIPEFMNVPMSSWIRSMQDPDDGCFYHPQWGKSVGSSRVGRDLDSAIYLLNRLGTNPMYAIPGNSDFTPTGPDTASAVALTSRLGEGRISAVASIVATASLSLPSYLQSLDAWRTYLESLGINKEENSYPVGNTLCSINRFIREADDQYEAANPNGEKAAFSTILLNFLNETQIPEIGLWEYNNGKRKDDYDPTDGIGYNGTNGLMKISVAYGGCNNNRKAKGLDPIPMNNAYNALKSAVKVAKYKNTSASETVCYVLNNWTCVSAALGGVKTNDPENYEAARKLVIDNLADMIDSSYDLLLTHKMEGGGFKYYETSPCNASQGAPVAYSPRPESDVNATTVSTTSTINAMFGAIRNAIPTIPTIPLWCSDDYYIFMDTLENLAPVVKGIPDPHMITFDDYGKDEEEGESTVSNVVYPDDLVYVGGINKNYHTSTVVPSTKPGASADDKALYLTTKGSSTDFASGPMNAYINFANELLEVENECYLFEADFCVESATSGGIPFQLYFLAPTANNHACGFNIYNNGGSLQIQDSYAGVDGVQTKKNLGVNIGDWFNLKLKVYKTYTENADGSVSYEITTKVYVNNVYLYATDCSDKNSDGTAKDVDIGRALVSCYRKYNSAIYVDNIYCEKLNEAYT